KASATALAGQGVMGGATDACPRDGQTHSFVAAFAEVEVDLETGKYHIVDYLAVADVGTVIHPKALGGQVLGRSILGIGHAIGQHWVYDQHYGVSLARRFHHNKPPTILDVPQRMAWSALDIPDPETPVGARGIGDARGAGGPPTNKPPTIPAAPQRMAWSALDIPDPETPVGARGIGEPPVAAGCCAVLNALSDAVVDDVSRRAPVMVGTLLASLEAGKPVQEPLTAHI